MRNKLIIAAMAILLILNVTPYADRIGDTYFDKALSGAAVTYATARVLNGIISVIQNVEVAATPAGVGLSVAPGQILDPLNDLVEQFSTVMLLATVSLAIQKLLLTFSGLWISKLILSGLLGLLLIFIVLGQFNGARRMNKGLLYKMVVLVLFVRFVIPFIAVSSGIIETAFLNEPIKNRTEKLQLVEQTATQVIEPGGEHRWHESFIPSSKNLTKVKENAALLKEKISQSINTIVDLIALFIIQTILLPIVFLYVALKLIKHLIAYDFSKHPAGLQ